MPNKINLFIQGIVVFLPASLIFYYALNAGALADNDYWGFITDILLIDGGFSSNLNDWVTRSNEHFVILPKLVYAANLILTGGNNVGLSLFAWLMAMLQVIVLYRFIPLNKKQPTLFIALLFFVAVFIFNPRQAHNWILGMSGVAWISANFFSIYALTSLHSYAQTEQKTDFLKTIVLSLCAIATYSTSLALFPTLIIAVFLLEVKRKDQLFITVFSVTILVFYFATYSTPSYHPSIERSVITLGTYFIAFMGALFSVQLTAALIFGFLGLASSLFFIYCIYQQKTHWKVSLPWIFIQLFACGNAAMASLARSGFGVAQAFSSRYQSLPALFWLSWIMLAFIFFFQLRAKYRQGALSVLLSTSSVMIVLTYLVGIPTANPLLKRAEKKSLALASIYSGAYDLKLIQNTFSTGISFNSLKNFSNFLQANHHIPFNGIFKSCPEMGSKITQFNPSIPQIATSVIDQINKLENQVIEVSGWAYINDQLPSCIVLTNHEHIVRGVAITGLSRPDIPLAIPDTKLKRTGWHGYGKIGTHDKLLKVFMLNPENHYWIPITRQ